LQQAIGLYRINDDDNEKDEETNDANTNGAGHPPTAVTTIYATINSTTSSRQVHDEEHGNIHDEEDGNVHDKKLETSTMKNLET
jgi:hypothetical protein